MNDNWYKLDNVSKVFLATHNNRDTRSIRVSCSLVESVDKELLEKALLQTIKMRPQFQVRIRRGFFWHYIESTDVLPEVYEEDDRPCPVMYGNKYKGVLHYKVSYYKNRINIDMFHAISDGTGALSFLKLLVLNYLQLAHPGQLENVTFSDEASSEDMFQNSYDQFYDKSGGPLPKKILNKKKKAYIIQGQKLPYNQLQFFEAHMEVSKLIETTKAMHVSMTSFLGAQLMMAIYAGMPFTQKRKPITISIPVDLRNYYPSETLRNFFNSVDVSHLFEGNETVESLAKEFDEKLKDAISVDKIKDQMNRYQSIERLGFTRVVPLAIKQPIVRAFSKKEAKTVTAVLSNLGKVTVPEEMNQYIEGFTDYCSTEKIFITVTSYKDDVVLGIASAYAGTSTIRRLIKSLKETGTSVKLYATEVIR